MNRTMKRWLGCALLFGTAPLPSFCQTLQSQPNLDIDGNVAALAVDSQGRIVFGGAFSQVNGQPHAMLARLNADRTLDNTWNPTVVGTFSTGNYVSSIVIVGDVVYFGGSFSQVDGVTRNSLAAVDENTGALNSWNPNVVPYSGFNHGTVSALQAVGTTIYVGGSFAGAGGQTRNSLAAVDTVQGLATAWNPAPDSYSGVFSMVAVANGPIYVAGSFGSIGGSFEQGGVAALDPVTGNATPWKIDADGSTEAVMPAGDKVYVGGTFRTVNGNPHPNIVVVDATTGMDLPWDPAIDLYVQGFALADNVLYVTGPFYTAGGQSRNGIAAFNATTGQLSAWDAAIGPRAAPVGPVLPNGSLVLVGGTFTSVAGQAVKNLAALTAYAETVFDDGFECVPTPPDFCSN